MRKFIAMLCLVFFACGNDPMEPELIKTEGELNKATIRGITGDETEVTIYPPTCDPNNPPAIQAWQGDDGQATLGYMLMPDQIKFAASTEDATCSFGLVGLRPNNHYWAVMVW